MFRHSFIVTALIIGASTRFALAAEDATKLHQQGVEALKESQRDHDSIVSAARCFAKSSALFEAQGKHDLADEANSYLYYCKKRLTPKDLDALSTSDGPELVERLKQIDSKAIAPSEGTKWLERADDFAQAHPGEGFLISVRYLEVAERFNGSDVGRRAIDKGLDAMVKKPASRVAAKKEEPPKLNGKSVNLLKLIDPKQDALTGTWDFNGIALIGEMGEVDRLEIPYQPPAEYDFKVVFMRVDGQDLVSQIVRTADSQYVWNMDSRTSSAPKPDDADSKQVETEVFKGIINGRWHTSLVQVRKDGTTIFFDGKQVRKLKADWENLTLDPVAKTRDNLTIGLGHRNNKVAFSTVELIEYSGSGKPTR